MPTGNISKTQMVKRGEGDGEKLTEVYAYLCAAKKLFSKFSIVSQINKNISNLHPAAS